MPISQQSTTYERGTSTVHLFITEFPNISEFSSVEKAKQFCNFLHTVLGKHASPYLQKAGNGKSYSWFDSTTYVLFRAMKELHQAD